MQKVLLKFILLVLFTIFLSQEATQAQAAAADGVERELWRVSLPYDQSACGQPDCHYGSPVLADISGDEGLEIIAVTNRGHVVAVANDGTVLWNTDIAPYFGMAAGTHEIHSTPAVDDLDGDGKMEVVVGAGTIYQQSCTQGGVIVLSHTGAVKPGWPALAFDNDTPPAGCRDTIFSSPALGDMDNDGDLEIAAGGFDKRVYVWHHNGTLMSGYPATSKLHERFPDWGLQGTLADNTWASPALADLDGDGYLDLIISTAEGNFDSTYAGNVSGWSCPYALPSGWSSGYCGGSLYAFDRFGKILPGFPIYKLEAIESSPAVADMDGDGDIEIFVGAGKFYYSSSPDHPTYGFRLYGFDHQGKDLPGWEGGKQVGGSTVLSPAIGDIIGDENPEVVTIAADGKLYAWHLNGGLVTGFPMRPRNQTGLTNWPFNTPASVVLADYDGDNQMEIIFNQEGIVNVVDGNGSQLTGDNFPDNKLPIFYAEGILLNSPAVGDLDNDGNLELVASNSRLFAWDLPDSGSKADWPMFKQNAAGTRLVPLPPRLATNVDKLKVATSSQTSQDPIHTTLTILNAGSYGSLDWTASTPAGIVLSPAAGMVRDVPVVVQVTISPDVLSEGVNDLGVLTFANQVEGTGQSNPPLSVPLSVLVSSHQLLLPSIAR